MITITQDAELMTNLVAANPVPAGNRFTAFRDASWNPAVLSHSEDDKLDLVITIDGKPTLVDFGKLCGISGAVQAFGLLQDPTSSNIWIAVAANAGNGSSSFYLVHDLPLSEILTPQGKTVKSADTYSQVHGIYMSNFTRTISGTPFPLMFLVFQPEDKITKEDELGYVNITISGSSVSFSLNTGWTLATNPLKILDVTFGSCRLGQGAFVLYETIDGLKLQFRVFEGHDFSVELAGPEGARCLAAYWNASTKSTTFLVGGDVITQYTYDDYKLPTGTGTVIVTNDSSLGLKDIHTAQDSDNLTIWYTTVADGAHYYAASISSINNGLLVPLLPDGTGGQISGLLWTNSSLEDTRVKTVVSVDEKGSLSVLQQAEDTGMWESHKFYAPSNKDNMEIQSFTLRIKAISDTKTKEEFVKDCQLHITSTGYVQVTSNGKFTTLGQDGAWYTADDTGVVTIIISTADMSCHTLQVDKFRADASTTEIDLNVDVLNPSKKLNSKLMGIQTGQDLLNAKTQTSSPVIDPGTVSTEDADNAASIVAELNKEQMKMGLRRHDLKAPSKMHRFPDEFQGSRPVHLAGQLPSDPELRKKVEILGSESSPWDFFSWLVDEAEKAASWVLQKFDDTLHFVVTMAGDVYRFVLDSITAVGKAFSWVWAKVKIGIEKLIEWIGFLFAWGDILELSDSIFTYTNIGLEYGQDQIKNFDTDVKVWVEQLRKQLKDRVQPQTISTSTDTKDDQATEQTDGAQHGVAYNWSTYQMKHGGFVTEGTTSEFTDKAMSATSNDDVNLQDLWNDIIKEVQVIQELVKNISQAICGLFDTNTTTTQVFAQLQDDMIDALCNSIENIADFLLKAIILILQKISDMGNYAVDAPIFTALWKLIANGRNFSVFNCLALIVAIPATIIYKLCSNAAPPTLTGRLTKDTFGRYLNDDSSLDPSLKHDITAVGSITGVAAGAISMELASFTMLIDGIPSASLSKAAMSPMVGVGSVEPGEIFDCVILTLDTIDLVLSWPLKSTHDQDLHWWIWGLDLSNAIFLATSIFVGWETGITREETEPILGIWELTTGVPIYVLEVIIAVHEFNLPPTDPEKDNQLTTRHLIEDTFQFIGTCGSSVAALCDKTQEEVALVGNAVFGQSLAIMYSFKFVDFILWIEGDKTGKVSEEERAKARKLLKNGLRH